MHEATDQQISFHGTSGQSVSQFNKDCKTHAGIAVGAASGVVFLQPGRV